MTAKLTAIIPILFLLGCSKEPAATTGVEASAPKKAEPVEVQVAPAILKTTDKFILVTGSLLPDETVTISSEMQGRVATIHYDFGQTVKKGEIIAELEKTEHLLQVERTKAALAQALSRVGLDPSQAGQTPTSTPAIRQAKAQMEDARNKFENAAKLVKSGDIAQERYTELEKALRAREAALEASRDDMRTLWANVEALGADVRLAEKKLRDCTLRAPFDGSVSERKVSPGQFIKDNTAILTLVKTNPLRLRLEVPESGSGAIHPGTTLEFTTEAVPGATLTATVRQLNPSLNEQSRTLIAEARLNTPDSRLRPGMFVQVKLMLARGVQAVAVPKEAVYSVAGLTKVFVVRDGKLIEHRIPPGAAIDQFVEVPPDLIKSGDSVVISNLPQLVDGQQVRVKS